MDQYEFEPVSPLLVPLLIAAFAIGAAIPVIILAVSCRKRSTNLKVYSAHDAASNARLRIAVAQQAAQRVRLFVSTGLSAFGASFFFIGLWPGILSAVRIWPTVSININGTQYYREEGFNLPFNSWMCLMGVGPAMLLLGLLPTDHRRVKVAARVFFTVCCFLVLMFIYLTFFSRYLEGSEESAIVTRITYSILSVGFAGFSVLLFPAVRCGRHAKETRWVLSRLWLVFRLFMLMFTAMSAALLRGATGNEVGPNISLLVVFFLCAFGLNPRVRRALQRRLGDLGVKGQSRSAAAIAALVGGRDAAAALAHGASSFRGLPFAALSEADFSSSGDSGLHKKTVEASLGKVDAFVSHSWHDAAEPKFRKLAAWAAARSAAPLVWLDKACIDQQRIDESLAALPVYLSGCQSLLVVIGPTYTTRLWCVIELFTFLQMGGDRENVVVLHLPTDVDVAAAKGVESGKGGSEDGAAASLERQIATFDALSARCFKPDERQRLLAIIEASFGDFEAFNEAVREILTQKGGGGGTGGRAGA